MQMSPLPKKDCPKLVATVEIDSCATQSKSGLKEGVSARRRKRKLPPHLVILKLWHITHHIWNHTNRTCEYGHNPDDSQFLGILKFCMQKSFAFRHHAIFLNALNVP